MKTNKITKTFLTLTAAFLLFTLPLTMKADAASGISVYVDNVRVAWTDAMPFINDSDRTMVPLRQIANVMDMTCSWDSATQTAVFTKTYDNSMECPEQYQNDYGYAQRVNVAFRINSSYAAVSTDNGYSSQIPMDTSAVIQNNRTFTPVKYLAEAAGYSVTWSSSTQTIRLYSASYQNYSSQTSPIPAVDCTIEEMSEFIAGADRAEQTSVKILYPKSVSYPTLFSMAKTALEDSMSEEPEFGYYTENQSLQVSSTADGMVCTITWSGKDNYAKRQASFEAGASLLTQLYQTGKLTASMTEHQRASVILSALTSLNTRQANTKGYLAHTAWASLIEHYGVCSSKTGAYNMLLSMDGIECWGQTGYITGQYHLWTGCVLDGQTVYTDATINSDTNFALSKAQMQRTHLFV